MGSYFLDEPVVDLSQYMLHQAHMMEWAIQGLVPVDGLAVQVLRLRPRLLDANCEQVRSSSQVPAWFDVYLRRGHQGLNRLCSMYTSIICCESYLDSFPNLSPDISYSIADIVGRERMLAKVPEDDSSGGRYDAEDDDWLVVTPP